jgi:nicotinate-nucleotide pyrophosphorylase (carboxylating)
MLKDNHWALLDASGRELDSVVKEARRRGALAVQVEAESPAQVVVACRAGANRLLIDNRSPEEFRDLTTLARQCAPTIEIEATGGITLDTVRAYAEAGADFVSIGALTHSVRTADLTLDV